MAAPSKQEQESTPSAPGYIRESTASAAARQITVVERAIEKIPALSPSSKCAEKPNYNTEAFRPDGCAGIIGMNYCSIMCAEKRSVKQHRRRRSSPRAPGKQQDGDQGSARALAKAMSDAVAQEQGH